MLTKAELKRNNTFILFEEVGSTIYPGNTFSKASRSLKQSGCYLSTREFDTVSKSGFVQCRGKQGSNFGMFWDLVLSDSIKKQSCFLQE